MDYSRVFNTNFPEETIKLEDRKDIDDTVVELINQYYDYINANDFKSASAFFKENEEILKQYSIDAYYINQLKEELYNTQLFALANAKSIESDTEPELLNSGSYWLCEY